MEKQLCLNLQYLKALAMPDDGRDDVEALTDNSPTGSVKAKHGSGFMVGQIWPNVGLGIECLGRRLLCGSIRWCGVWGR